MTEKTPNKNYNTNQLMKGFAEGSYIPNDKELEEIKVSADKREGQDIEEMVNDTEILLNNIGGL